MPRLISVWYPLFLMRKWKSPNIFQCMVSSENMDHSGNPFQPMLNHHVSPGKFEYPLWMFFAYTPCSDTLKTMSCALNILNPYPCLVVTITCIKIIEIPTSMPQVLPKIQLIPPFSVASIPFFHGFLLDKSTILDTPGIHLTPCGWNIAMAQH